MEPFEDRLKRAGLTGNESKVYLELLKRGELNGSELAKKVTLDRSLTYTLLNNLVDKGLVSYVIKKKKRFFRATDPSNLVTPIETKLMEIKNLIPELKEIEKLATIPQAVRVYEGKEGMKILLQEMLRAGELLFFGGSYRSYDVLKWEMPHYEKLIKKISFPIRGIVHKSYLNHPGMDLPSSDIRFLEDVKSDATTTIFGDSIAIHVLLEKPFVIIIKNKIVNQGYRNYFEFMWKHAKRRKDLKTV
ncbi:TrmB family transcriptional regulator [Nanoarchaeota archaeon]